MPKVLISDSMSPRAAEIFAERGLEVDVITGMSPEELKACIGDYDGLAVRSATKATAEIIAAADNLKVIGRAGIGVDNIDIAAASGRGIVVMNTPFGNSITTAEHAIAMIFALARDIPEASQSTHAGKWEKSRFMGVELYGKTLGIIGCGNIGSIVADRALGLKMKVAAYDPFLSPERATDLGVDKVELIELFARADFISLHTPLTDATRGIIDAAAIEKMKDGVRIINCARGGLVIEADLKAALDAGKVAGAGMDVFQEEPAKENILFGDDKVVATPHLGASTNEAQVNVAIQVAEQMSDYLLDGAVVNALNMPSVSAEDAPKLMPYMKLAEQLGSFAGQVTESALKKVQVEFCGQASELNTKPLTAVVLQGLLSPLLETVNMVSAPAVAKERNIEITESTCDSLDEFQTLVRLTVTTEQQTRSVAGTLAHGDKPRLIEIKDIAIDAELGPNMLYITNEDKPGLIGALGTLLGEAGINIATFNLGRGEVGGDAIALVETDEPVSEELAEKVRALPHVVRAMPLKF
ncbi:MAG: phosphoglycerate dehydrogenase [Rhodospirillales bacterium]|jgi:D-3-phosphoglycerate dehydrogenase|nr:phosphoglycerate dehydrogenase [Rhodospirillaceae bacterium]MDP6427389.1 phosphoglycerate dehydrogenase [Rhodospirillales bacterium]MDP6643451.1 phosphoglycerate dehydrogenase [Rhodospirillales bacterium]MDP6840785.1 phosphoglycerate dehydrogenase [Rhodospirillales bacterium]